MEEKFRILMCDSTKGAEEKYIENNYKAFQRAVGGSAILFKIEEETYLICNARNMQNPQILNRMYRNNEDKTYEGIYGKFFIIGCEKGSDNFKSLSDNQLKRYEKIFEQPQKYYLIEQKDKLIFLSSFARKNDLLEKKRRFLEDVTR